jgi:hypothetical protein
MLQEHCQFLDCCFLALEPRCLMACCRIVSASIALSYNFKQVADQVIKSSHYIVAFRLRQNYVISKNSL